MNSNLIEEIISKTKKDKIIWTPIGNDSRTTFVSINRISDKKFIRLKMTMFFHKGFYERVLMIEYYNGKNYKIIENLFARKYTTIYDLLKTVKYILS